MAYDQPHCPHCHSDTTFQVVPLHRVLSPWECSNCGAIFGTDTTDSGLLRDFARPPTRNATTGSRSEIFTERCIRCETFFSPDDQLNSIITQDGRVCEECITFEELKEI